MARPMKNKKVKHENTAKASAPHKNHPIQSILPLPPDTTLATVLENSASTPETAGETYIQDIQEREWDSVLGEELPDTECTQFQKSIGDEEDMEIATESALDSFTKFLVDAQAAAQKAEHQHEQEGG
ncbi:hypothetical protein B0H10DRAFT_1949567 [Mycena sp. CBHHK59/15]|nr:hypothetical protein B0H10DRAFT_1949567 [Mycena sp. CBHHK59/15]